MIACNGMALVLAWGQSLWLPGGQYLGHITKSNHNLFINCLLGFPLTPGLTRPLWDLLGHYAFY